ncbi:MAG: hypothetical protein MUO42_09915 [Anaerolineaceae bacterium]|jgi:hypothetical protein|nr:hypothetical protein [Anaerolineaceae bacterium]
MKKRFGVLRVLSSILKILGIITAALAVLGGLIAFVMSFAGGDMFKAFGIDSTGGVLAGLMGAFLIVVVGAFYAIILYGYGELLMLLISMEENTFKTVKLLEDVTSEEKLEVEKKE